MIVDALLNIIIFFFRVVLYVLPDASPLPQGLHTMATQFNEMAHTANAFFPVYDVMIPMTFLITIAFGVVAFKIGKFTLGFIRGSGS